MSIAPQTAIITGASSGIGRETAIHLANAGWNIVIVGRRADALRETEALCPGTTGILSVAGDVTEEAFVKALFDQAVEAFSRVDLLFNNAGISSSQVPIEELSLATFQNVINVNVTGSFLCAREAFRVFKLNENPRGGRIINNGSLSAHTPRPFSYAYTSSKHAVMGLTKCIALDGRQWGITCTQIDIGNAHTSMGARLGAPEGTLQANGTLVPEATLDVKHVAETIVYIAGLPNDVMILDFVIAPRDAPFVGRG